MKCPRDTNGDGDCGRNLCPYCGKDSPRHLHRLVVEVIGRVAADCWDEKTIVEHVEDMDLGLFVAGALRQKIAEHLGFEGEDMWSPAQYLDHQQQVVGRTHLDLLDDLRELACEMDPKANERHYGKARNAPKPSFLSRVR